jgi:hypothetical protein
MKAKTALLFCAGSGQRWSELGYPKQLFKIQGTPILERTITQLREHNVKPIIVTNDERLMIMGVEVYKPSNTRWLVETIIDTQPLWRGPMIGIFGDVIWTHEAMDTLCTTDGFRFLGREMTTSRKTGGCPELFGWTWSDHSANRLMMGLCVGLEDALKKDPDGANYNYMTGAIWQPYRAICNIPIDDHCKVDSELWLRIDDFTDDVDYPQWASRLRSVWERHEVP